MMPGPGRHPAPTRAPRLPAPTRQERTAAADAARALRRAFADPASLGPGQTMHVDLCRPRSGVWITTWPDLPGFLRDGAAYSHALLPNWTYARDEILAEMIPDLEALAERGLRPTQATRGTPNASLFPEDEILPIAAAPAPEAPPAPAFDARDHRCRCGAWGGFGHRPSAERPGTWFCFAHDPCGGRGAAGAAMERRA